MNAFVMADLSRVEFQLLALLNTREKSGRDVAVEFEAETGKAISYGTLYTTLRRLREAGYVSARDDLDKDGRIRFFVLTGAGRRVLTEARQTYAKLAVFAAPNFS